MSDYRAPDTKDHEIVDPAELANQNASPPPPPMQTATPGWYPDQAMPGTQRYWDGWKWSENVAPLPRSRTVDPAVIASGAGVIGIVVGAIGPWATAVFASRSGLEGDGVITLIVALCAGVAVFGVYQGARASSIGIAIAGLIVAAIGIYDLVEIQDKANDTTLLGEQVDLVKVGWGLYLTIIAGVGTMIAGITAWANARS